MKPFTTVQNPYERKEPEARGQPSREQSATKGKKTNQLRVKAFTARFGLARVVEGLLDAWTSCC